MFILIVNNEIITIQWFNPHLFGQKLNISLEHISHPGRANLIPPQI
jgi:hypothetical protein